MTIERQKFRPNEPDHDRAWQEKILDLGKQWGVAIDHDAEYFKIPIQKPDGTVVTHLVSKHSGLTDKMTIKGLNEPVAREEVIEAIVKIYPEFYKRGEKPNLIEALQTLRARRKHQ